MPYPLKTYQHIINELLFNFSVFIYTSLACKLLSLLYDNMSHLHSLRPLFITFCHICLVFSLCCTTMSIRTHAVFLLSNNRDDSYTQRFLIVVQQWESLHIMFSYCCTTMSIHTHYVFLLSYNNGRPYTSILLIVVSQ